MPYVPFHDHFPEIAERETRTVIVYDPSLGLPPGDYNLFELYCDEPGCDCRRVFFYVVSSSISKEVLAVIAYGWEPPGFYVQWMGDNDPMIIKEVKGPALNLGSPQSKLAPAILEVVKNIVLKDSSYIERLKTHYRIFRDKIDNKKATVHHMMKKSRKPKSKKKRKS